MTESDGDHTAASYDGEPALVANTSDDPADAADDAAVGVPALVAFAAGDPADGDAAAAEPADDHTDGDDAVDIAGADVGVLGGLLMVVTAFGWLGSLCFAVAYVATSGPDAIEGTAAFSAALLGSLALSATLLLSSGTSLYLWMRSRRRWQLVLAAVFAVAGVALCLFHGAAFR
ncbi:hypothetical protein [Catellatospora tritici]|uniref:hypothetical protein n=1 Tax=Catellatospora tritici TaxID=2851566 RepID=UPI001C2D58F7|nr:hypothetical protein [Catellatospora tritici]MBV1851260.1 hypothetical protein [Catellatospora tritici]